MYASIIPCKRDNYSNSLDDRDTFYSFKNQMKTPAILQIINILPCLVNNDKMTWVN